MKPRAQADVGRFALLLVLLIGTVAVLGLVGLPRYEEDASTFVRVMVTVLSSGILLAAIRVTRTPEHQQRRIGLIIAIATFASIASFLLENSSLMATVLGFVWILLVIATPALVLKEVLSADRVTVQTILGAFCVYLLLGIALAYVAMVMDATVGFFEASPRSTAFIYFAFVTVTTVGYGDLAPFTDGARMVSVAAAVIAQMYIVVVVARLVSMWTPIRGRSDEESSGRDGLTSDP